MKYLFCIYLIVQITQGCKKKVTIDQVIESHSRIIKKSCILFKLNPRLYISVIYGELINNYDEWDKFDNFRAEIGMDPSVGFAQIKVSTAMWLEDNHSDSKIIFRSKNHEELVNKLVNDSTNILYSAFYIKLIRDKLLNKFHKEPSIKLLASYYGKGIDYYRENDLDSSYYNQIGITAEKFYNSNKLLNKFPSKNKK